MKKLTFSITFILLCLVAFPQTEMRKAINNYFNSWQKGQSVTAALEELKGFDPQDVLSEAESFTTDTLNDKRSAAYHLINEVGHQPVPADVRKRAIKQLTFGLNDPDGGIIGNNLDDISSFPEEAFDTELRYMLSQMAKKPMQHYETLIKICGWLNLTVLSYDFRQMINEKQGTNPRQRWAMRIAMARMGEPDMIEYCLRKAENAPVGDDVIYELIPDLVYTRQKPFFDYMITIIQSDEKRCSSPNPDSDTKILCAYGVIEKIAPYIKDFPIQVDSAGDLIRNDYTQMLKDVRAWISENPDYTIMKGGF